MKLRYKIASGFFLFLMLGIGALALVIGHTSDCVEAPALASATETMQAYVYRCYGSADVLSFEAIEKPTPAANEVLVRVHKAAVNPLDWHYMRGSPYLMRLLAGIGAPNDIRMGVDYSGTVAAIGEDVTRFNVGDAVFGGRGGAFAEYVVVPEDRGITHKPENVSFTQAAAVAIAAVTALQALRDKGELKAGQHVLINGASGGVGSYAVQIAKAMGAEVTGVCSTRNLDMVRALGADQLIDYKNVDYTEADQEFDLIVDMVGNRSLSENRRVMVAGGKLVMVGGSKGDWIAPLITPVKALLLGPFVEEQFLGILAEITQDDLAILGGYMARGEVSSAIDRHYALRELPDAIRLSESGRARGKIIIDVYEPPLTPPQAGPRGDSIQ